ncbi:MAG: RNA polymerase sigma factor [Myxococcota bacterium]|nr:RNA polymerase sigma factor [Myxococcota bacterium]MDW8363983.1 RNA polymerase sigma factor [Myxococcales bacterium]
MSLDRLDFDWHPSGAEPIDGVHVSAVGCDEAAFVRLLAAQTPRLQRAARRWTRNRADAEDLVQQALMLAWRARSRFVMDERAPGWLRIVLRNAHVSELRRRARERRMLARLVHETSSPDAEWACSVHEFERTLARLPEPMREAIRLVDLEQLSYREAAARLGCPPGTVMSRLHRARRRMARS